MRVVENVACEDSHRTTVNKPLKFGRIRASYPDVRPMSESRKSDGDMLDDDLESCSLARTTLKHTRARMCARTHTKSVYQKQVVAEGVAVKPYLWPRSWLVERDRESRKALHTLTFGIKK